MTATVVAEKQLSPSGRGARALVIVVALVPVVAITGMALAMTSLAVVATVGVTWWWPVIVEVFGG